MTTTLPLALDVLVVTVRCASETISYEREE